MRTYKVGVCLRGEGLHWQFRYEAARAIGCKVTDKCASPAAWPENILAAVARSANGLEQQDRSLYTGDYVLTSACSSPIAVTGHVHVEAKPLASGHVARLSAEPA